MPVEGMERQKYLEHKFGGKDNAKRVYNDIYQAGKEIGIFFQFDKIAFTPNSFASHKLLALAYKFNKQNEVMNSLFFSYFIEGKNIGNKEILINIKKKCDDKNFAVTNLSHSRTVIELKGNNVKEILKKGCPINFSEFKLNNCANSIFHGITITIDMINDNPETFRIFALRSFGESLYHSITDACLEDGYKGI